jgi:catechol 2,3-dioxygenase-like lactoylglutathione lyase family enzyme
MFHHIGLRSEHPDALIAFYEAALQPLGYAKLASYDGGSGFGRGDGSSFWIEASSLWIGTLRGTSNVHLAFSSPDRRSVDAFFAAALGAGGKDYGALGIRSQYHSDTARLRESASPNMPMNIKKLLTLAFDKNVGARDRLFRLATGAGANPWRMGTESVPRRVK